MAFVAGIVGLVVLVIVVVAIVSGVFAWLALKTLFIFFAIVGGLLAATVTDKESGILIGAVLGIAVGFVALGAWGGADKAKK